MKLIWNWQNNSHFWQNEFILWATSTYSAGGALYWMKQLFLVNKNSVKNGCFFPHEPFAIVPGIKNSFEHNNFRKNLLLSACFCWNFWIFLGDMDQKFKFGGTIGYEDSYLFFLFRDFKVVRLHAILHDAAWAVPAHSGKCPGLFYMIERGPNSCFLGHVTGLLFCLYVKLFLPSIFNSFDFWSSMSCTVLDMELADKNINEELGVFIDGKLQGYSFRPPKKTNPQKKRFNAQETCTELCRTVNAWTTVSFQAFFPKL